MLSTQSEGTPELGVAGLEKLVGEMSAEEETEQTEQSRLLKKTHYKIFGLIPIDAKHAARNTVPLSKLAHSVAKVMSLPLTIDESGETVPNDIVNAARGRGLELKFGPGAGEWKVVAGPGGAQLVEAGRSKRKGVVIGESEQEQGQIELMPRQLAPEGFGVSVGASREDLRQFVNKFESSAEHAQRGDGEFAASYMELTVLSVVGINCLVMAMEHYRGRINMECEDAVNCPHNIEIMSPGFRLFINLAEYFFNGEAPNTESASGKGNHCSDVDTHWKPSGLQSLGISRSSCSMHARWQIVHSPGSMHV